MTNNQIIVHRVTSGFADPDDQGFHALICFSVQLFARQVFDNCSTIMLGHLLDGYRMFCGEHPLAEMTLPAMAHYLRLEPLMGERPKFFVEGSGPHSAVIRRAA